MAKEKRYFWLKLKDGFFDDRNIKLIRALPDGHQVLIIYLLLQLRSLKTDGTIEYSRFLPDFMEEIAIEISEPVEAVKNAIQQLEKAGLLELVDGEALFMTARQEILDYGSESASAERTRKWRERQGVTM